ncbi:DUF2079 domain-containing protein [Amycolatopsis sp. NPDC059657]|uniref:DUF2079 domain-containing protein n=1 Tax=Amycolatopsis sp. NPDC059657 TaxID=3346899 RepID=UPI00366B5694
MTTHSPAPVVNTAARTSPPTVSTPGNAARARYWALWAFAAIPAVLALLTAIRAPRMHVLLDYWHVLAKVTDDQGRLLLGQVFTFHLDQPFVLPSLLFWADAAWFGGDNRVLTVLTVVLVAGSIIALRSMLPAHLGPTKKAALTAGMSWLLFSSHAAELWLQGTNGISWIPAVFFCTLAIAFSHHGRPWAAVIAATMGCLSFGAALPIWFVIALIAWLRNDSRVRILVYAGIGAIVVAGWWLSKPAGQQSLATSAFDPDGRISVVAAAVGGLWSADLALVAVLAGVATSSLLALLISRTILDRIGKAPAAFTDAGWVGVAVYSLALAIMLGLGRTTSQVPGGNVGLISRYVTIAALATTALLTLLTLHRPRWPLRHTLILIVAVSLATHAIGGLKADNVRRDYTPLELAAIALRVDAPTVLEALHIQRGAIPAARALGTYPFNNAFSLGCNGLELGGHVDLTTAQQITAAGPATTHAALDSKTPSRGDSIITGWALVNGAKPDCVLVTDTTGTIVGGGITGLRRTAAQPATTPDGAAWQAVTGPTTEELTVLIARAGVLYRLTTPDETN